MESEIYPVNEYVKQATNYISKLHDIPEEEAKDFVLKEINKHMVNPIVTHYKKDSNGDKQLAKTKLTKYIQDSLKDKDIIVPSFTTYYNTSKQKSIHSEFMASNTKKRSAYKKAAFKAKQDGDIDRYNNMNSMQKATKILNNSLSGVYGSKSTILFNPSAHYTLTSMTRCISSIGNSVTESFVYGNKHFKSPEITLNYIVVVVSNVNITKVKICIGNYKLHIPTVDEIMSMVEESSKWYWSNKQSMLDIRKYVETLTDEERVAVMYVNNFWHFKQYNEQLVRNILNMLTRIESNPTLTSDVMEPIPELYQILAKCILHEDVKGKNINYKELEGTELGSKLFATSLHIHESIRKLDTLFHTFFLTNILPPSIAYIKEMFRAGIVLSDTDSTCCSYDKWTEWYGDTSKDIAIASTMVTLLTLCIDNALYNLSKNMNIGESLRRVLGMKNEFYWPVFISSNTNKHYFASVLIQEGNVFKEEELEIKGVHFIASNANQEIVKDIKSMMVEILSKVGRKEDISLLEYMNRVKGLEKKIEDMVKAGNTSFFKQNNIKDASAYANGVAGSPYLHYDMWKYVFQEKYGQCDKPPYMGVKIPVMLDSKKAIDAWLETIDDKLIVYRLNKFFTRHNKTSFNTFMLPATIVNSKGIPTELNNIINMRRIILDNLKSGYMVLETLGLYLREDELVSDII